MQRPREPAERRTRKCQRTLRARKPNESPSPRTDFGEIARCRSTNKINPQNEDKLRRTVLAFYVSGRPLRDGRVLSCPCVSIHFCAVIKSFLSLQMGNTIAHERLPTEEELQDIANAMKSAMPASDTGFGMTVESWWQEQNPGQEILRLGDSEGELVNVVLLVIKEQSPSHGLLRSILDYVTEVEVLRDLIVMTLEQIIRTAQLSLHIDPQTVVLPTRMNELLLCDSFRAFAASSIVDDNCLALVHGVLSIALPARVVDAASQLVSRCLVTGFRLFLLRLISSSAKKM